MADLTISNPQPGANAVTIVVTALSAVAVGQPCYQDPATGAYAPCNATTSTTTALIVGVSLCASGAGEPLILMTSGDLVTGGTVAVGVVYQVSSNSGKIAPTTDVAAGWFMGLVGHGIDTATLRLAISQNNGVAHA